MRVFEGNNVSELYSSQSTHIEMLITRQPSVQYIDNEVAATVWSTFQCMPIGLSCCC